MSDNGEVPRMMDKIKHLKELVQNLEEMAVSSEHQEHIASAVIKEHKTISNYLDKMKHSAENAGRLLGFELMEYLLNPDELLNLSGGGHWNSFLDKLKVLKETDEDFRECCLSTTVSLSDNVITIGGAIREDTLLHVLCSKNPPVEVVRTLLDILPARPVRSNGETSIFNHLAYNRDGHYPLHKVVQMGGSLELVKLLINVDSGKQTLTMTQQQSSVYHILIANREVHQPEIFSEILRYLCCIGISMGQSALLEQASSHEMKTPVLLLVQSLINKEGLNYQDILRNRDFTFLLKATCYHYISKPIKDKTKTIDTDMVRRDIEAIPLSEAFLVCAPCFNEKIGDKVLNELLSVDCQFLFEKDSHGRYPIHRMITEESYFMNTITTRLWSGGFLGCILKIVLKHAPKSAQLVNHEGRLPLHIVSDAQERRFKDSDRLDLVKIIWNAYPEAAETLDSITGLPPFALAVRGIDEEDTKNKKQEGTDQRKQSAIEKLINMIIPTDESLSSSFFLLRQQPDIISNYMRGEDTIGSKDTNTNNPDAKRTKIETTVQSQRFLSISMIRDDGNITNPINPPTVSYFKKCVYFGNGAYTVKFKDLIMVVEGRKWKGRECIVVILKSSLNLRTRFECIANMPTDEREAEILEKFISGIKSQHDKALAKAKANEFDEEKKVRFLEDPP